MFSGLGRLGIAGGSVVRMEFVSSELVFLHLASMVLRCLGFAFLVFFCFDTPLYARWITVSISIFGLIAVFNVILMYMHPTNILCDNGSLSHISLLQY